MVPERRTAARRHHLGLKGRTSGLSVPRGPSCRSRPCCVHVSVLPFAAGHGTCRTRGSPLTIAFCPDSVTPRLHRRPVTPRRCPAPSRTSHAPSGRGSSCPACVSLPCDRPSARGGQNIVRRSPGARTPAADRLPVRASGRSSTLRGRAVFVTAVAVARALAVSDSDRLCLRLRTRAEAAS